MQNRHLRAVPLDHGRSGVGEGAGERGVREVDRTVGAERDQAGVRLGVEGHNALHRLARARARPHQCQRGHVERRVVRAGLVREAMARHEPHAPVGGHELRKRLGPVGAGRHQAREWGPEERIRHALRQEGGRPAALDAGAVDTALRVDCRHRHEAPDGARQGGLEAA